MDLLLEEEEKSLIDIAHCHADESSICGYCQSNKAYSCGFHCNLMKTEIYQSLMNSGSNNLDFSINQKLLL